LNLKPIRARSVSEAVYEQLRDAILSGEISAGTQLPGERKLCETLEVNRGALREALKRLEQDQLVVAQQGEGTRVRDFRKSARLDLLLRLILTPSGELDLRVASSVGELRGVMMPDMIRLAALRRSPDHIERLREALAEMEETQSQFPAFQEKVEALWAVVAEASENVAYTLLNNTMRELHVQTSHQLRTRLGLEFVNLDRYNEIVDAIIEGDEKRAHASAQSHSAGISQSLGLACPDSSGPPAA